MKIQLRFGLVALAGLLAGMASPISAQAKIGYVNVQQVMAQAPGIAEARQTFEAEVTQAQPELQRMQAELATLQQQFEQQQATLSEQAKQQRQQEFQQKVSALQQRQQELQRREQELIAPIMTRVEEIIDQIRREGNYAMIFDTAQSGIIAADESLDLTNRVLDRLKTQPTGE